MMQIPQFLHTLDPRYQGIPVHLNSDEAVYFAHVEEALTGRPGQSDEAIVGDPAVLGTHMAFFERIEAGLFRFTGWNAPQVEQAMDSIVPPLLFLTLILFFSLCGASRWAAYVGALAFVIVEFYSLSRPIQPRDSFLVVFLGLSGIIAGVERKWIWGVLGGMLLGVLVGAYFWAWTFAWLWLGLLGAWEGVQWIRHPTKTSFRRLLWLKIFAIAGVVAAIPSLLAWWKILRHPLYDDASFRSGLFFSHMPESWIYSMLFAVMTAGVLFTLYRNWPVMKRYRYLALTILTAFIAIHQQLMHGVVFNYVSHYLFALVVAAIGVVLLWNASPNPVRKPALHLSAVAALIYLAAIAYDGRFAFKQFTVTDHNFDEQHFSTLLPVLDELPRATILSDTTTSLFIAGSTKHDVVYTPYLKNLVMSHEEIAERFCVTELPIVPADRHLEGQMLIWPDANSAFPSVLRGSDAAKAVRDREITLVEEACKNSDRNPAAALKKFHVEYVLWDKKRNPGWNLTRLGVPLMEVQSGSGWSLWRI